MTAAIARLAFALGQPYLRTITFPSGRVVRTNLDSIMAIEAAERYLDYLSWYDWDRYDLEPPARPTAIIEELPPVPGSTWDMVVKYNMQDCDDYPDYEYEFMMDQMRRDHEIMENRAEADEVAIYARLERAKPKARRRQPLPAHHHKRWGHGNSRELINRVGQFAHLAG